MIPLVDLSLQHAEIADEVVPLLDEAMTRGTFIGGEAVAGFEAAFATASGARHCIGVANGTDALELALRAAGIGAGDGVVVPANTFIGTVEALTRAGAHPVLVDCDEHHLIDVEQATRAMASHDVRAVVPVHLYGQIADVEPLLEAAERTGCVVVADAAQAHGATRHGLPFAANVLAAATSFYPGKNLGAYGDAGAVVTNDDEVARLVRLLANHGSDTKYVHDVLGVNSRLDSLQAIVLRAKLRRLEGWNGARAAAASRYDHLLAGADVRLPVTLPGNRHVWHLYVVGVERRDEVLCALNDRGVGAAVHYPTPVHLHRACAHLGQPQGSFPVAEAACRTILSLPLYPGITDEQQQLVAEALLAALG